MSEKYKFTYNDDVIIAGRQVEIVTGYAVDECLNRLHSIEKGGWFVRERIKVKTDTFGTNSASFEIRRTIGGGKNKRVKKIKGSLQSQNDGTTLVQAEVPPPHGAIAFGLAIIVLYLFIIGMSEVGFDSFLTWFLVAMIPITLFSSYWGDKNDTAHLQQLLSDTLYVTPNNRKRKS